MSSNFLPNGTKEWKLVFSLLFYTTLFKRSGKIHWELLNFLYFPTKLQYFLLLISGIVNSMYCLQEIAEHVFGYQVENVLKVKTFQFRGTTPFAAANDHYVIKCMTKVFDRN